MTPARRILPGMLVYVTVRTVGRMMRLRPDRETVETIRYCLACVTERYRAGDRIRLHEFCFLSNHYHLLVTDVVGCLPDFVRDLNALLSRALNAQRGHSGANFEKHYGLVHVESEEKAFDHAVYTLANPAAAHLVERAEQWPGVCSVGMAYGTPLRVERPDFGLWKTAGGGDVDNDRSDQKRTKRLRTRLPEAAELVLDRPPVLADLSDEALRTEIHRALRARERELARERRATGRKVLGARRAAKVSIDARPRPEKMFSRNPTFSGVVGEARRAMAAAVAAFRRAYREASRRFRAGEKDVVFPAGTWLFRVRFGVRCEQPAPLESASAALAPP